MSRKMNEMMKRLKNLQSFREEALKLDDEGYEQLFGIPKNQGLANIDKQIHELNRKVALEKATNKGEMKMDDTTFAKLEAIAKEESWGIKYVGGLTPYGDHDDISDDDNAEHNFPPISLREVTAMLKRAYELGKSEGGR